MLDSVFRGQSGKNSRCHRENTAPSHRTPTTNGLIRAIRQFAQTDGDYNTSIPALRLHRRAAATEPLHCIYNLGLGVVAQGRKQVLIGDEAIDYGPGQSMLTTIDLPVVSHVTRATAREPFLGMMLTLDVRSIVQMASEMDAPRARRTTLIGRSRSKHSTRPCSMHSFGSSTYWTSQPWFPGSRR